MNFHSVVCSSGVVPSINIIFIQVKLLLPIYYYIIIIPSNN